VTEERRVGVTGSRHASEFHRKRIRQAIEDALPIDVLVHGGAAGADKIAGEIAAELGIRVEVHEAYWDRDGRAAGPLRNQRMVNAGAMAWLAFPMVAEENRGTWDCVRRAVNADVHVFVTPLAPRLVARLKVEPS